MPDPEQPVSTEATTVDTATTESTSDDASTTSQPSPWHQLFGLLSGKRAEAKASGQGAEGESGQAAAASTLTLTAEELDRRVQAETDRRAAKRQREDVERAAIERKAAAERKLDPNARDYDPHAGAEELDQLKREEEAAAGFGTLLTDIAKQHDTATIDVLKEAVPAEAWARILQLEGAGSGLDGRKLIVSESLKALERHWRATGLADAKEKLRSDPAFRKEILAELRGTDYEEPELLPANGAARSGNDFMDMIQNDYDVIKGRRSRRP